MLVTLFRIFGVAGIVLMGAALAFAPVLAFENRMTIVSALGIAGIACLLVAWWLRRRGRSAQRDADPARD